MSVVEASLSFPTEGAFLQRRPTTEEALALAERPADAALLENARVLRDQGFGNVLTYSKKVFIPLTYLCRDVCHYCTFAKTPRHVASPYMSVEDAVAIAREGAAQGCKEALLTLGEKPELRYAAARDALAELGFATTLDYVAHVAAAIHRETGLLPHINAGNMTAEEIQALRAVSASMGIMLESASERLCEKGMPHHGSPDKIPSVRLETLRQAGLARVPFTTGILIGIGETRQERIESLLAIRDIHDEFGHIQEIIVQNFRAKPDTKMARSLEPNLDELLWTLAVTRLIFGPEMSIQVPPNLSPGVLARLVDAGINDWGGVSPITPDHVNPEAPWPHLDELAQETARAGKFLEERLTLYPHYALNPDTWLASTLKTAVLRLQDGGGFARADRWQPGNTSVPPQSLLEAIQVAPADREVSADIRQFADKAAAGERLSIAEVARLFEARGKDFSFLCQRANALRQQVNGDVVTYVVNRNINYTNICYFKCNFCAFSKGKTHEDLRGKPYDISNEEIRRRVEEAWQRGATEVCMQGGIHPHYDGSKYLDILQQVKAAEPEMHIHAFSPLEVWQGAETLGLSLEDYLRDLKDHGLGTLPGTAAEVLDDRVRAVLCPDKINTAQWLEVIETAHRVGFKTTATIMYGHVDDYESWGRHLLAIRDLQAKTGGFTEFVPLPFVAEEAPVYRRGQARRGPTFRESVLMHAIARLVFHGQIDSIQASWVKMGPEGLAACLDAGVNDLGGTLMNESITRAAGAQHGQEMAPAAMDALIKAHGRIPKHRTTLYGEVDTDRQAVSYQSKPLIECVFTSQDVKESEVALKLKEVVI
jgi:FO synthase